MHASQRLDSTLHLSEHDAVERSRCNGLPSEHRVQRKHVKVAEQQLDKCWSTAREEMEMVLAQVVTLGHE